MPDDAVRILYCLVQGHSTAIKVTVPADNDADDMKKIVYQEMDKDILRNVMPMTSFIN